MGSKEQVRDSFLSACENITGEEIQRRGPTEVKIDESFAYSVLFVGHKRAIESITLAFSVVHGDPHADPNHPTWAFIKQVSEQTGWEAYDTFRGATISIDT
jgi:hypothetical protein